MRQIEHVQAPPIRRKLQLSGKAVRVSLCLKNAIDTYRGKPLVRDQVKDPDLAVVPLRNVKGTIVRSDGDSEINALRVSIRRFEPRRNLDDAKLFGVESDDGNRKRGGAAVGGNQPLAIRAQRQSIGVGRNFHLLATGGNQATVGQHCFAPRIDLDGTVARWGSEFSAGA